MDEYTDHETVLRAVSDLVSVDSCQQIVDDINAAADYIAAQDDRVQDLTNVISTKDARIRELEANQERLVAVLRDLCDEQNGPPRVWDEQGWFIVMAAAKALLNELEASDGLNPPETPDSSPRCDGSCADWDAECGGGCDG